LGRESERRFVGLDGKPILGADDVAGWSSRYDDRGHKIEQRLLGLDGRPRPSKEGQAGWRIRVDEQGHEIEKSMLGVDGAPCIWPGTAECTARRQTFDGFGNELEVSYVGRNDELVLGPEGIARQASRYDERRRKIESADYDAAGRRMANADGVAITRSEYDPRGNLTERHYFDADEKPVVSRQGYAGWRSRFDARGREVERTQLGIDGKPVNGKAGWARVAAVIDDAGQLLEKSFFDSHGRRLVVKPRVMEVDAGMQGDKVGLQAGDLLLEYDDTELTNTEMFVATRKRESDAKPRKLLVRRGDKVLSFEVMPGPLGMSLANYQTLPVDAKDLESAERAKTPTNEPKSPSTPADREPE
jgi:hypothetical protein